MKNKELIALNQDALYQQAYVVKFVNDCYIIVKDVEKLNGNKRAFAVYNPTDATQTVQVGFSDLDLSGTVTLRDVFQRIDLGEFTDTYEVSVPRHGTRIYVAEAETRLERTRYEAEAGYNSVYQEIKNNQQEKTGSYNADANCSGGYKAGWLGSRDANDLQWRNVYSFTGGEYKLTIGYISGESRNINVSVNGQKVKTVSCNSGGWDRVGKKQVDIQLNKGVNTIRLSNSSSWMPDIDYIELTCTQPAAVNDAFVQPATDSSAPVYDLSGRKVVSPTHGLYVRKGRVIGM